MNIYQRPGSPFWYFDVPDPSHPSGRRRRSTKTKLRKEAERIAAGQLTALFEKRKPAGHREVTLAAAIDEYIETARSKKLASVKNMEAYRDKLLGLKPIYAGRFKLDGSMLLSALTEDDLKALKKARAREGMSPGSAGNEVGFLRSVSNAAKAEDGCIPADVAKWRVTESKPRDRYLTVDEAHRLLQAIHPNAEVLRAGAKVAYVPQGRVRSDRQDAYDLCVCLLLTGCRWDELGGLTRSQVDLDRGVLTVRGKGNKVRDVPMAPLVVEVMARRLALPGGHLVFPGRDGEKRDGGSKAIYRAIRRAGLNDPAVVENLGAVTIHTLRHTYASWLRHQGVGLDEVQRMLGHANIQMTLRYAKVLPTQTMDRVSTAIGSVDLADRRCD